MGKHVLHVSVASAVVAFNDGASSILYSFWKPGFYTKRGLHNLDVNREENMGKKSSTTAI